MGRDDWFKDGPFIPEGPFIPLYSWPPVKSSALPEVRVPDKVPADIVEFLKQHPGKSFLVGRSVECTITQGGEHISGKIVRDLDGTRYRGSHNGDVYQLEFDKKSGVLTLSQNIAPLHDLKALETMVAQYPGTSISLKLPPGGTPVSFDSVCAIRYFR